MKFTGEREAEAARHEEESYLTERETVNDDEIRLRPDEIRPGPDGDQPSRPDFFDRYEELVVTVLSTIGGGILVYWFGVWFHPIVKSNVEALFHWLGWLSR
jgi:hypothetical protein